MLASKVATPPMNSATRGLETSLIHPSKGAPMGVLPRKAMALRDMTLPRMAGSARSWSEALLVATKEMDAAPITTRRTSATVSVGASATARMATPNTTPMKDSIRMEGRLR